MLQLSHATPADLHAAGLDLIGPIARLQVQVSSIKQGERPNRWYDPAPMMVVSGMQIDTGGITGISDRGELIADIHHRDHVRANHNGKNGISVGFTSHYHRMRERFGDHLMDGIAAENILIETELTVSESDISGGVAILTSSGAVMLTNVLSAPPCVEFSKFCAGYGRDQRSDHVITEALQFLSDGTRGFYATLGDVDVDPAIISPGDLACRVLSR